MKPINEMNLEELAKNMDMRLFKSDIHTSWIGLTIDRLRQLHAEHEALKESTRWIPAEERMPTEEDAGRDGFVEWWDVNIISLPRADYWDTPHSYPYWRRINPPEEV